MLVVLSLALGLLALPLLAKVALTVLAVVVHTSVEINAIPGSAVDWIVFWASVFLLPMLIGASLAAALGMMRAT